MKEIVVNCPHCGTPTEPIQAREETKDLMGKCAGCSELMTISRPFLFAEKLTAKTLPRTVLESQLPGWASIAYLKLLSVSECEKHQRRIKKIEIACAISTALRYVMHQMGLPMHTVVALAWEHPRDPRAAEAHLVGNRALDFLSRITYMVSEIEP